MNVDLAWPDLSPQWMFKLSSKSVAATEGPPMWNAGVDVEQEEKGLKGNSLLWQMFASYFLYKPNSLVLFILTILLYFVYIQTFKSNLSYAVGPWTTHNWKFTYNFDFPKT